ncbi:hypothetical protein [Maritalea sp.]|uniref:hypothetical protein n=1 Tax=Maritalea sp. TaxID=2003361 RepID=UPI003EF4A0A1
MKQISKGQRALAILAIAGFASSAFPAQAESDVWRFFVADHERPQISVLESGKEPVLWDELLAPARLYKSADGGLVFAVQRNNGRVDFGTTGLGHDDHGDHKDMHLDEPQWNGLFLTGYKPTHFVVHDHSIAAFMDGTGSVQLVDLDEDKAPYSVDVGISARPHHGVAVPLHDHLLISEPPTDSDSSLPSSVRVLDQEMQLVGEPHKCDGLHGEATSGDKIAFACTDGILVFDEKNLTTSRFFAYPEELGEGRSGRLDGGQNIQFFAGNFGKDKMIFIDVEGEGQFTALTFEAKLVSGYLDPENAAMAFALTADGKLHKIDALSGKIVQSTALMAPIDMEGGHSAARPAFTFAGANLALVDPAKGHLHLINKSNLLIADTIQVGGKPFSIVAVGGHLEDH